MNPGLRAGRVWSPSSLYGEFRPFQSGGCAAALQTLAGFLALAFAERRGVR